MISQLVIQVPESHCHWLKNHLSHVFPQVKIHHLISIITPIIFLMPSLSPPRSHDALSQSAGCSATFQTIFCVHVHVHILKIMRLIGARKCIQMFSKHSPKEKFQWSWQFRRMTAIFIKTKNVTSVSSPKQASEGVKDRCQHFHSSYALRTFE